MWTIIAADAATGVAGLGAETVDCVVTSPPYYWQRDYGVAGQIGHEVQITDYVAALVRVFAQVRRVLRPRGTLFLNLGDTYYSAKGKPHGRDVKQPGRAFARDVLRAVDGPGLGLPRKSLIGIPWRVALALQTDGWTLRSDVIWQRPTPTPEPSVRDRPRTSTEHVFIFSKGPRYYFDRAGLDGAEDVWVFPRAANPDAHAAPFPAALAERCIRCGSEAGGMVLDPFAGSGTTLVAAHRLARRAIGIDLSPTYVERVQKRLDALR